jgi:hypothetical protein
MNLREHLDAAATELPETPHREAGDDGSVVWSLRDTPFTIVSADGATASFRLDPVVAAAARRTPDTTGSARGPDWVEFRPAALDGHAIDRATAWFAAATRRVG